MDSVVADFFANVCPAGWAVAPQFGRAKRNPPVDFQFPVCAVGKKTS